jgi:D-tyrosyl-tRNA(Tyr) deacylase
VIAVLQRVREARVEVAGRVTGQIGPGLLVLVCAEPHDTEASAEKMVAKWLKLRIFSDAVRGGEGKMNLSLQDVEGGLLIVSQFTLAADVSGGNRPSFTGAAPAEAGRRLYDATLAVARRLHPVVQAGEFGADMQVHLVNDGPVTIPMQM